MRRAAIGAVGAVLVLALTACSQARALGPVSGDKPTKLRTAAITKLTEQGVPIVEAPQCETTPKGWTCPGMSTDEQGISVVASSADPFTMTITVGGRTVYQGLVDPIITSVADVP